ncbi:DegT/DnrJ/EryC1/StrS aminotransferase family protein [Sporosarcina sp. P33]|uniref:DegT/DnrJ/EryC1/StrS family aminotransferase n=1 Tax=Sporosarcina sp. P33 TaxID=1930764 RepID=UPI0009BE10EA|nr:aminotransferase class I/II-fold pyridoxal phosphate-dependent enzyme [Sporosarcina sp. P33]ARD48304.1 aminotransferase [Sporosarcina sp. P33]
MSKLPEGVLTFDKTFTRQEPIPASGIERATELMRTGKLHRYNTEGDEVAETSILEEEFAKYIGTAYCAAFNSCGSSIYVALKSIGVQPGDKVLCNAFTLAPVPGAIKNAEAQPVFVEITKDYVTDLDDLEQKAKDSGAKYFLLSHMRGHIADMDRVVEICERHHITLIEDCAHTMGAKWNGRHTGTFGAAGCFSTQTYKHLNSGEGGLLVTDDEDVAAKAILYSGSYMLYEKHTARPSMEVFERYKKVIPNFSLRMSNLVAVLIRSQLPQLDKQCERWNERYYAIEEILRGTPNIYIPLRDEKEQFVASSFQFTLLNATTAKMEQFIAACAERGVEIKWFGNFEPKGFTSRHESWQYLSGGGNLPNTAKVLDFLCDFRLPLTFTVDDCRLIAKIIREVCNEI